MTMKKLTTALLALALAITAAACGDEGIDKDWEEEIVLQLFKPKALSLGTITVSAASGSGQPVTLDVNTDGKFFTDCESNRIRILPRKTAGVYQPVQVTISGIGLSKVTQSIKVPVTATDKVAKVVLQNGKELEPKACAPNIQLKVIGQTCSTDGDCEHGKCLKKLTDGSGTYTFNNGACSMDCKGGKTCPSGSDWESRCVEFSYLGQPDPPFYCIKKCVTNGDCRVDGYSCTGVGVCLPDAVKP